MSLFTIVTILLVLLYYHKSPVSYKEIAKACPDMTHLQDNIRNSMLSLQESHTKTFGIVKQYLYDWGSGNDKQFSFSNVIIIHFFCSKIYYDIHIICLFVCFNVV